MRPRLHVVFLVGLLWVLLIGLRLYQLQVVSHERYARKARQQQQRVVRLDPPRGTIYDATGRELAVSVEVDSAYAVPSEIGDHASSVAQAVAGAVPGVDGRRLERVLAEEREFVWVARKLDPPAAAALRQLHLPGIHFVPESKRYYPMRQLAAEVLGYVGVDNTGLAGLEKTYDSIITGKPGVRTVLRDAKRGTARSPDLFFSEPQPGGDLYLTLDASVQHMVERELQRAVEERRARRGSAVFLDPETGAVLAMASYPTFDPNEFERYPPESKRNRSIMDAYEPGSTFKIFTAAAALESGLVHSDDPFDCGMGSIVLSGITIHDHKPYGMLTFADVIAKSSNVGVIRAALIIGGDRLYHAIRAFGFGRSTGIDLPVENPGILHALEHWGPLTKAYVAFGQGIAVTPLQLAAGVAAVANGGRLLQPYVVATVRRGEVMEARHPQPKLVDTPVTAATAAEVRRLLERVVTDGTGKSAAVAGYRVAGKTGTAQIPQMGGGGYRSHEHLPSFVGFAPADRPSLVGVVAVEAPQGMEYYGAQVAAPVFGTLVRQVLLYLGVRPERPVPAVWPGEVLAAATPPPAAGGATVGAALALPGSVVAAANRGGRAASEVRPAVARGTAVTAVAALARVAPAAPAAPLPPADDDAAGEDDPQLWRNTPAPPLVHGAGAAAGAPRAAPRTAPRPPAATSRPAIVVHPAVQPAAAPVDTRPVPAESGRGAGAAVGANAGGGAASHAAL